MKIDLTSLRHRIIKDTGEKKRHIVWQKGIKIGNNKLTRSYKVNYNIIHFIVNSSNLEFKNH